MVPPPGDPKIACRVDAPHGPVFRPVARRLPPAQDRRQQQPQPATSADFLQHKTDVNNSHDQLRADFLQHKTDVNNSHDQLRADFEKSHDQLRADFEKSHDQLRADFAEHKDITERNHRQTQHQLAKLSDVLGDARERLARIEGYLRIGLPEPPEAAASG